MISEVFVSVVAPIHDVGAILEPFVNETVSLLRAHFSHYELIVVDDGSDDLDLARLTALLEACHGVRVLHLSREFGEDHAIAAGLDSAIGDYVVTLSPGADPPNLIPQLVGVARDGADVVIGVRRSRATDPWWMRQGAELFYRGARRVFNLDMPPNATHFRCLSRQALNALNQLRDSGSRLKMFTSYIGFASQSFSYDQIGQTPRSRSRTPLAALATAVAIVVDNSNRPLRIVSMLGVLAAAMNLLYAIYVVAIYALKRQIAPGWVTLSLTNAAQFFLLSIILSVLCEYVGQLRAQVSSSPRYYVKQERVSSVLFQETRRNVVTESEAIRSASDA